MNPFIYNADDDATPATFNEIWLRMAKRFYLILAIPTALLFFSLDGGWTAMRIAMHDYAQTEGIITDVYCGRRYSSLEYTYNAGKFPQHSRGPIASCRHYQPGGAVTVYYSTQNPDLSVINMSPGHYF